MSRFINTELKSDSESSDSDNKELMKNLKNLVLILNKSFW